MKTNITARKAYSTPRTRIIAARESQLLQASAPPSGGINTSTGMGAGSSASNIYGFFD